MRRTTPLGVACAALAAVLLSGSGCGPKLVRTPVFQKDQPSVRVELQRREQGGAAVPRGFEQPATIADVRIAHILGDLTFEGKDGKRQTAIRSAFLYDLAGGIAVALAQATPDDEVVAAAFPEDRRFGIFTDNRVTSFRLHLEGDSMRIEFMAIEDPLEKEGAKVGYAEYQMPSELPVLAPTFVLVPSESIVKLGSRGVAVAWRDEIFQRPVSLVGRDGVVKKRTVLMELPPEKSTSPVEKPSRPPGLSEAQTRALDKLDAARSAGAVTEADYQRRRRLILENKLGDLGDGETPP